MSFLDVWKNKENNVDNVMADDVNLLAEYISRNENNIEQIKQNIKRINYTEIDSFMSGYAIVEDTKTIDSLEGQIVINFVYPLFAETVETFGNIEIHQTRVYNGELQKRTVGEEWENYLSKILDDLSTVYRYMGSLKTCADLPDRAVVGDVWNIEQKSYITDHVILIQNATCNFSPDTSEDPVIGVTYHLSESLGHTGTYFIRMYDSKENKTVKWEHMATVTENSIHFSFKQSEGFDFHYDGKPVNTYISFIDHPEYGEETINVIAVNAGDNVAWNGTRWDVLAGTVDLTGYVKETELDSAVRSVMPITSNTIPSTLAANTEYYLGESTAISFAFPDIGSFGQYCFVKFVSGAAATVLTVTGSNYTGTLPTPAANKTYEILATWNGEQWVCSYRGY